jgi:ABC-type transport system involved in cytochrome bd biosynthesis fused ATPase/permease subunit
MRTLYGGLLQILMENLEGWQTIRSCEAGAYEYERVSQKLDKFRAKGIIAARLIGKSLASGDFVTHTLIAVCLVALGYKVAHHQMSPADSLFYPFYLTLFFFSAKALVLAANEWTHFRASGERLFDVLAAAPAVEFPLLSMMPKITVGEYTADIRGLKVKVGEDRVLLDSLSLRLSRGKITALMGPSGCGKSTLLEVLAGLRKAQGGNVEIQCSGMPVWNATSETGFIFPLRLFSFVEQKPYLFEGTLRANLTLGRPGCSDHELQTALAKVNLQHAFAARGGLDMLLTDRGQNVSEGQLYRIAVARVLLLKRPFLLLDEPFAALDEAAAKILSDTLHTLRAEMSIVVVTHFVPPALRVDELRSLHAHGNDRFENPDFPSPHSWLLGVPDAATACRTVAAME